MENVIIKSCEQFGTIRQIKETPELWCGADVAKALGYANPRKALIDHCKGVTKRDTPTNSDTQKMSFIPEADVYRLICHSKLPKAQEFEKWVFEDVVPKAVHGEEPQQMTFDNYIYFDKTYRGQPVLTVEDVSHLLNVNRTTVNHSIKHYLDLGTDYCYLEREAIRAFKVESPKVAKEIRAMNVVMKSGFEKLCKMYGANLEPPKIFIEEKKVEKPAQFITPAIRECMAEIRREAQRLINLTYLLDDRDGLLLCGETYYQCKMAIVRQMKAIGTCVVIPQMTKTK